MDRHTLPTISGYNRGSCLSQPNNIFPAGKQMGEFPLQAEQCNERWDAAVYLSSQQKDKYTSSCLLNLLRSLFSLNSCSTSDNDSRGIFSSRLLSISMPIHLAQVEGEEAIMSFQKNLLFTVKSNLQHLWDGFLRQQMNISTAVSWQTFINLLSPKGGASFTSPELEKNTLNAGGNNCT